MNTECQTEMVEVVVAELQSGNHRIENKECQTLPVLMVIKECQT